jgi:NAD(P)-dependent dehydrogenase (short-subunit alcohol dehydrogenase family)
MLRMRKSVAIITGANGGMGREITKKVLLAGYETVMACRNIEKSLPICQEIEKETNLKPTLLQLDLASFNSILAFVETIKQKYDRIDLLLNNAGVLSHYLEITEQGVENTIGVNYLGHYLLTRELFPLMGEGTRIVNMISLTYRYGKIDDHFFDVDKIKHFNRFTLYSNSKLAFLYFSLDIAGEWKEKGITVNCADPGIVSTNIIRMGNPVIDKLCDIFFRPLIKQPLEGAGTLLYLALSDKVKNSTGNYFRNKKRRKISKKLLLHPQRQLLKEITEEFIQQFTSSIE